MTTSNCSEFLHVFEVLDVSYNLEWDQECDPNDLFWWSRLDNPSPARDTLRRIKDFVEHKLVMQIHSQRAVPSACASVCAILE